jgi:predicted nucleotidyltransferase
VLIDKQTILKKLEETFLDNDKVYAFWLEGSDAMGCSDEYSDIDIWFDVEDSYINTFVDKMRETLTSISPMEFYYESEHSHPQLRQFFIRLENTSKFLVIDMCIQSHSREIEFVRQNKDEVVKVIFDKSSVIKFTDIDVDEYITSLEKRKEQIKATYEFFSVWVEKGIARDDFLEALSYYHEYILGPLVEYLRIIHEPTKKSYRLKHIRRDLPSDVVAKLEYLYKAGSLEEIEVKTREAVAWLDSIN